MLLVTRSTSSEYVLIRCIIPRFGGSEFPPELFFKIYLHADSTQIKYISGKKVLTADSQVRTKFVDQDSDLTRESLKNGPRFLSYLLRNFTESSMNRLSIVGDQNLAIQFLKSA
jgi:hypothetical protein